MRVVLSEDLWIVPVDGEPTLIRPVIGRTLGGKKIKCKGQFKWVQELAEGTVIKICPGEAP